MQKPRERRNQSSICPSAVISVQQSPARFMADCDDRVIRWELTKKVQKLSRTWPIWPPCICTGAVCTPVPNTPATPVGGRKWFPVGLHSAAPCGEVNTERWNRHAAPYRHSASQLHCRQYS
jgi:hypothetical protein